MDIPIDIISNIVDIGNLSSDDLLRMISAGCDNVIYYLRSNRYCHNIKQNPVKFDYKFVKDNDQNYSVDIITKIESGQLTPNKLIEMIATASPKDYEPIISYLRSNQYTGRIPIRLNYFMIRGFPAEEVIFNIALTDEDNNNMIFEVWPDVCFDIWPNWTDNSKLILYANCIHESFRNNEDLDELRKIGNKKFSCFKCEDFTSLVKNFPVDKGMIYNLASDKNVLVLDFIPKNNK